MYKILITNYDYKKAKYFINYFNFSNINIIPKVLNYDHFNLSSNEISNYSSDVDAIITQFVDFSKESIKNIKKYKIIINNNLLLDKPQIMQLKEKSILTNNIAYYSLNEIAIHTIALYLSLIRKINYIEKKFNQTGNFHYSMAGSINKLSNMNLGFLGFGKLSYKIAEKSLSLGFNKILVHDPSFEDENINLNIEFDNMNSIISKADILLITPPYKKNSYKKIDKNELSLMKDDSYVVNIYKKDLLNEDDLYKCLKNQQLRGAAIDVLSLTGPEVFYNKLFNLPNVIITPNMSWYSDEVNNKIIKKSIKQAINHLI